MSCGEGIGLPHWHSTISRVYIIIKWNLIAFALLQNDENWHLSKYDMRLCPIFGESFPQSSRCMKLIQKRNPLRHPSEVIPIAPGDTIETVQPDVS